MTQTEEYLSSTDIDTVHLGFELLKRDTTMSIQEKEYILEGSGFVKHFKDLLWRKDFSKGYHFYIVKLGRLDDD